MLHGSKYLHTSIYLQFVNTMFMDNISINEIILYPEFVILKKLCRNVRNFVDIATSISYIDKEICVKATFFAFPDCMQLFEKLDIDSFSKLQRLKHRNHFAYIFHVCLHKLQQD